ncbi:hypothetical protein ACQR1W_14565 [Bradyrhizobium sp. HKCCYLS1011]|uniref:hypothetical protein n=1 Tax=Bradyrhizobium sp. HKCCYLS1011 TaxID=3420733 RepID=UPI003EB87A54
MMIGRLTLAFLAAGAGFAASPVVAQSLTQPPKQQPLQLVPWQQIAPPADEATDYADDAPKTADADPMKDVDITKLDWSQLNIDASSFFDRPEAKTKSGKAAAAGGSSDLNWSNNNKANGASAVSVKQSVSPFWDARIGADMTVTKQPTTMSELLAEKADNGGSVPQSGGSAWAAVTAPGAGAIWDKTAIEARVDPNADQSKIGTTVTKAVPLDGYNLSLQNGYNLNQQGMVPLPGAAPRTNRSFDTEQSAKLSIGDTGTSVTAGQSLSSSDDKWLRKVGAEQKLYDGVTISGSVGETAQGTTSKSISAGFKRSW